MFREGRQGRVTESGVRFIEDAVDRHRPAYTLIMMGTDPPRLSRMLEAPVSTPAMPKPATNRRLADVGAAALSFGFGTALCLWYGRIGFMPLDQSIVFDGAWRVLSGQVPYRDFYTPTGLVPILIQAGFFRLLGTTWLAYCVHAALMNGAFAALAYLFLRAAGLARHRALLFAGATAVVAYTPFGVPAADQHAFFFTFLAIALALAARNPRSPLTRGALWAAVPPVLLLGLLSKQIPTLLAIPVIAGIVWRVGRPRAVLRALSVGLAATVLAMLGLGSLSGIDWERFWTFFLALPGRQGLGRLGWLVPSRIARRLLELPMPSLLLAQLPLLLLGPRLATGVRTGPALGGVLRAAPQIVGVIAAVVLACGLAGAPPGQRPIVALLAVTGLVAAAGGRLLGSRLQSSAWDAALRRAQGPLLLAAALHGVCLVTIVLTFNESANCVALAYLAAGLVCLGLERIGTVLAQGRAPAGGRRAVRYAAVALTVLCAAEASVFQVRVNATRLVHSPRNAGPPTGDAARIGPALAFMRWLDTPGATASDYAGVAGFLRDRAGGFFLLGDSSVLYALTGHASPNPSLWFHEGLATPRRGTDLFDWYEARLLDNLRALHCRYLVLENQETFMGVRLEHFPRLSAVVHERGSLRATFGPFVVLELEPPL